MEQSQLESCLCFTLRCSHKALHSATEFLSLTSYPILLLERSREKFTGFNAVTQHNSTIHSVLKTLKKFILGSHTVC